MIGIVVMSLIKFLFQLRWYLIQAPSFAFYAMFSWVFPTRVLRLKAALSIYPSVRKLLLQRSGIAIGKDVTVGFGCCIHGISRTPPAVTFADRCAIATNVTFVTSSYPEESTLSSHPEVQSMIKRLGPIIVEEDAWIGSGVIILPGITIGKQSIVGAGAVVTKDVHPRSVVAGVPARVVKTISE